MCRWIWHSTRVLRIRMSVIPGSVFLLHNLQMHWREKSTLGEEKGHNRIVSFLLKLKPHLDLISQTFFGAFVSDALFKPTPVSPIRDFHPPVTGLITESLNALLSSPGVGEMGTCVLVPEQVYFAFVNFKTNLHLSLSPVRADCTGSLWCPHCDTYSWELTGPVETLCQRSRV